MDAIDPARRVFVSYIDKSREYYLAQGFGNPYRWAHNASVPFARLARPLAAARIGLVTTASLAEGASDPEPEDLPPGATYAAPMEPPPAQMYTRHRFWDKEATHTDDVDSFLPIRHLIDFRAEGRVGALAPRFYGVPTEYSQRRTCELDAPEVLRLCREDGVDAALLVAL